MNRDWIGEVLEHIDHLVEVEAFETVDDLLSKAQVELIPLELSVGYLLSTVSVKQRLTQRATLFKQVEAEITRRGLDSHSLLTGLE